jgi:hypothetical protein
MEDRSPLPKVPLKVSTTDRNWMVNVNPDGSFILGGTGAPPTAPTQFTMDGLPPGLVVKGANYGAGNFSPGMTIDPKTTVNVTVIIGYVPASTLSSVPVRGKVINVAKELNAGVLSLTSFLPDGPTVVSPIAADGTVEVASLPIGAYHPGVRTSTGSAVSWGIPVVIAKATSDLTIDLGNSPFPEFEGINPKQSPFIGGKAGTITGVMTQNLTPISFNPDQNHFFRMDVKHEVTGIVTSWAVHVEKEWQVPQIRVGDTVTVPGIISADGTPRLSADPF